MATDQECVGYAREYVRLAGLTDEPEIHDQLFGLAREWMAAAMHDRDVLIFPHQQSKISNVCERRQKEAEFCVAMRGGP